jgi:hypothetical protein
VLGHLLGFVAGVLLGWVYAQAHMPRSRSVGLQMGTGALAVGLLSGAWVLALCYGRV